MTGEGANTAQESDAESPQGRVAGRPTASGSTVATGNVRRPVRRVAPNPPAPLAGLGCAALGVALAWLVHWSLPAVPMLTAAVVLGIAAAHLPGARAVVRGAARPGLSFAGKRLMRAGVVLLGLKLSLDDVLGLGWASVVMVLVVVAATFGGTWWLGRRLRLPGDQPLLIATGYSICGASAIGAVSEVSDSDERDAATSVALVTLCGTLAILVLPLLHHALGLSDTEFGRWVGASVHDVGQVVATAQTAGTTALSDAVLVKLMRVAMLAPLVAAVAMSVRARTRGSAPTATEPNVGPEPAATRRPPLVPLFVVGFLLAVALRTTSWLSDGALDVAATGQEILLAAALFGLGSAVHLPSLARTGGRVAFLGLASWIMVAGVSYAGVLLTT